MDGGEQDRRIERTAHPVGAASAVVPADDRADGARQREALGIGPGEGGGTRSAGSIAVIRIATRAST
ncbi:MAG: hypothetical protein ACK4TJ_04105 [Tabrizicola sp.]